MDTVETWGRFEKALRYYQRAGYQYVSVPWVASRGTMMLTCPDERFLMGSDVGLLVGSAEQSFMEMDLDGKLPPGRYMALTPCFRKDDEDFLHQQAFMKLELYDNTPGQKVGVSLGHAENFLTQLAEKEGRHQVRRRLLEDGSVDLELNGIEIGSYGKREAGGLKWVYATGLAEPRFSRALTYGLT